MKKNIVAACILIFGLLMTACSKGEKDNIQRSAEAIIETKESSEKDANSKLEIYTSIYPLYDFAIKVGGDKVSVTNLVPAGTEPHDWEPATTDILSLEKADILIYNGVGMEHWVDQVSDSLENKDLILQEASKGITLLESGHDDHENEEADEQKEDGHGHQYDPHIWLSIKNGKKMMENIKNFIVEADPENKDYYEANYEKYAEEFDALDQKFTEELSAVANKDLIVAHEAFAYLCADYGLNQVAIEGLAADSEPDAKRMAEIINFAREKKITTIFFEELVSPKVAQTIASEIGAKTDVLNPLEGLTQEQLNAGEDYLSVMEDNLNALVNALK